MVNATFDGTVLEVEPAVEAPEELKSYTLQVKIEPSLKARIKAAAKDVSRSRSSWVRELIIKALIEAETYAKMKAFRDAMEARGEDSSHSSDQPS